MSTTEVPTEAPREIVDTVENTPENSPLEQVENTEQEEEQELTNFTDKPNERIASLEEGVTGIKFMNAVKVEDLMTEIEKNKPIGTGSYKKVYKLNDKEVISVEVNMKRKNRGEKKTETEFTEKEKEEYETIMKKMHALNPEHKKYLLLPTEYGYSSDGKTRVQILPYCNQNGGKCLDLYNFIEGKCTYDDQSTIMTDCVNILKTIHELHEKNIVCMDIKLENTFVNCPDKAYLSLGDTDGFKLTRETRSCPVTPGYYVEQGHFITDYYAWLQVFLIVYVFVQGKDVVKLYNSYSRELHGQMYMLRNKIPVEQARRWINKILKNRLRKEGMTTADHFQFMENQIKAYRDDKVLLKYCSLEKIGPMKNFDSEVLKEIDDHIDNSKTTSLHEDYEKLIKEILGKLSPCVRSILKALEACIDVETVNSYIEDNFYKNHIKKIIEPITEPITKKKSMFERMRGMFGKRRGGRKSKKSSRGKKKTRRKKKKTRRKKKKTRRKKKKTRGKKRR